MKLETETLDKLFLELSQFTGAKTAAEISLQRIVDRYGIALMMIREGCDAPREVAQKALAECDPLVQVQQHFFRRET